MSDPRLTPDPALVTGSTSARIIRPVVDLCRSPEGPRDRQLLFGETVTVLGDVDGWSYVQSVKDGYCGHLRSACLGPDQTATHIVSAPATHVYARADFKSADRMSLSHASRLRVTDTDGRFACTSIGYVPLVHLTEITTRGTDPADIAALFLGTPYLWGGNSRFGIDCSGVVQAALLACGLPCPGDSDMQQSLGVAADGGYRRNDLLFWKGHVALVTSADQLIHANAGAMACVYEGIEETIHRIETQGDGPVTAHRRLPSLHSADELAL
ncbi:NlpC/P60 domain protein [Sulfitobacter noctilucicola]|uniref:Cell wall-associated NlpC family hydrolase n=1 Tax=Sulfitobacter noctilucicola TaxID=1342301 RepID=A0A7W6M4N5_9RHOB|nr:NlpC/P60 family protein [Sulfitobacter noctilucicola]KIN63089.1 NlpC/P60 domain protein [Sulfitobacter noctilucicola]MBB4172384.1 cell wall-associated NlpC family hydrolase [Sulfitobacter noctilucicola]